MTSYQPQPGPQQANKYGGHVGPNYMKYGEQPGYVYYAPQDKYYTDPNYAKQYADEHGYGAPKPPGLGATVLPIAAAGGALALGQALGKDPSGFVHGLGGLFGLGGGGSSTPAAAATQVASGAPGLLGGLGGSDVAANGLASAYTPAASQALDTALGSAPMDAPGLLGAAAPYLGVAGAGLGAYGLYNGIKNHSMGQSALSGAGLGAGIAAASPLLLGTGPVGWGLLGLSALGGGAGGALLESLLGHKSTGEYEQEKWGGIAGSSDPATAAYGKQYMDYLNSPQQKIDALPENRFDYKQEHGTLKPEDVWGGAGQFDTFGGDWLNKYSEAQRRQIAQEEINQHILGSEHGDITVTDPAKARAIAEGIFTGKK